MSHNANGNGQFKKGHKRSEESRRKQSETLKAKYSSGERKVWQKGQTKETNPSLAQAATKQKGHIPWNKGLKVCDNPKLAEAHKKSVKTRKKNGWKMPEEGKEKLKAYAKAHLKELKIRRAKQRFLREGNGLERLMWDALDKLGIQYIKNPKVYLSNGKHYRADIVIGKLNIECDGKYFHSPVYRPWQVEHDAKRDADFRADGYLVVRLPEEDIRRHALGLALKIRDEWIPQSRQSD